MGSVMNSGIFLLYQTSVDDCIEADSSDFKLRVPSKLSIIRQAEQVSSNIFPQNERQHIPRYITMECGTDIRHLFTFCKISIFSKLVSIVVSTFTASYMYYWPTCFHSLPLKPGLLPTFDGRAVQYPSVRNLRDYMSWRQADCAFSILLFTFFIDNT